MGRVQGDERGWQVATLVAARGRVMSASDDAQPAEPDAHEGELEIAVSCDDREEVVLVFRWRGGDAKVKRVRRPSIRVSLRGDAQRGAGGPGSEQPRADQQRAEHVEKPFH